MKRLFILTFAAVLMLACSHVKGNFRNVDGNAFDLDKMEQVRTGLALDEVIGLVGNPYSVTEEGEKVIHRYFMVREKIDKDKAIGVISLEKKTTETYEVVLTYENNILMHKNFTRSVDKPKEKAKQEVQGE